MLDPTAAKIKSENKKMGVSLEKVRPNKENGDGQSSTDYDGMLAEAQPERSNPSKRLWEVLDSYENAADADPRDPFADVAPAVTPARLARREAKLLPRSDESGVESPDRIQDIGRAQILAGLERDMAASEAREPVDSTDARIQGDIRSSRESLRDKLEWDDAEEAAARAERVAAATANLETALQKHQSAAATVAEQTKPEQAAVAEESPFGPPRYPYENQSGRSGFRRWARRLIGR